MKRKTYKRKPGDFEIRVLDDGRLIMIAPDETLLEVAQALTSETNNQTQNLETDKGGKAKTYKA